MAMSSNNNDMNGGIDNLEEYSTCSNCGHVVPTANLMVHDANCRRTLEHAPSPSRQPANRTQQLSQSETLQQTFGGQSSSTDMSSNDSSGSTSASHDNLEMTGMQNQNCPSANHQSIELAEGQWQCQRCTLINEGRDSNCDACLSPRDGSSLSHRPPDATIQERLVPPQVDNGWVNVGYPQFHRGQANNSTVRGRNSGSVSQLSRIFNGLVNGAIIGSVVGGAGGMLIGGLAGAAGGAMVDRARQSVEENELRETANVANMLANEGGGIEAGTVRVHRANGHLTALASVGQGQNRLIRVRYGPRLAGVQNAELQQRMMDESMSDLELSLLETLVRMSYARGGTGLGNNIILQPEESFEELIQRFGLGTENRGASAEVIDSYPVEIVQRVTRSNEVESAEKQSRASSSDLGKCPDNTDITSSQNAATDLNDASESEL
ncbi:hypothetical protein ACHAXH_000727, partial [Discostella pseudostelligera]